METKKKWRINAIRFLQIQIGAYRETNDGRNGATKKDPLGVTQTTNQSELIKMHYSDERFIYGHITVPR